jgi:hypothetical protein
VNAVEGKLTSAYGFSSSMVKPSTGVAAAYFAAAEVFPSLPENCQRYNTFVAFQFIVPQS